CFEVDTHRFVSAKVEGDEAEPPGIDEGHTGARGLPLGPGISLEPRFGDEQHRLHATTWVSAQVRAELVGPAPLHQKLLAIRRGQDCLDIGETGSELAATGAELV